MSYLPAPWTQERQDGDKRLAHEPLAHQLWQSGDLSLEACQQAIQQAHQQQMPLMTWLQQHSALNEQHLAQAAAKAYALPFEALDTLPTDLPDLSDLPTDWALQHHVIPLTRTPEQLTLGIQSTHQLATLESLRFQIGLDIHPVMVPSSRLEAALKLHFNNATTNATTPLHSPTAPQPVDPETELNQLLSEACWHQASDIHLEPYQNHCRVRLRIDGQLHEWQTLDRNTLTRWVNRIKIMAQLDIAETRRPQDGQMHFKHHHAITDMRISTLPTPWGEHLVLRLLSATASHLSLHQEALSQLGMTPTQYAQLKRALDQPQGLILVTGPTGSGKSTTLYSALQYLNQPERHLITAEDPIEVHLNGVSQVSLQPQIGFTFAQALRAFLRQDPDVIMIGEIRDQETAEMAIRAAQTGHLVLSTLHTGAIAETLLRLRHWHLEGEQLASSLQLLMAQRLVRRLCQACRQAVKPNPEWGEQFAGQPPPEVIYQARGCPQCYGGYQGRLGLYHIAPMTAAMRTLILNNASPAALESQLAEQATHPLRHQGLQHVIAGITSLAEIDRVVPA